MNVVTLTPIWKVWADAIDNSFQGIAFVHDGCAPTAGAGLTVNVASGNFLVNSNATLTNYAGGSVVPTSPVNFARCDIVFFSSAGALTLTQGTEAALPIPPAIPAGGCMIAVLFMSKGATDYSIGFPTDGIEDLRVVWSPGPLLPLTDNNRALGSATYRWATASIVTVTATNLGGTLSTAAQANVTSLGTLTALTISGNLTLSAAASRIVPGATSLSLRNNADSADNLIITDAGVATVRSGLIATPSGNDGLIVDSAAAASVIGILRVRRQGNTKGFIGLDTNDLLALIDANAAVRLSVSTSGVVIAGTYVVGATTAINASGIPQVPTIGTTFATGDTTMTNANQFYTAVTLGSALAASGTYLIMGNVVISDVSAGSSRFTIEIRDTTNNVTIASIDSQNTIINDVSAVAIPAVTYSGYAGTPTIVVRCESSGAADVIKSAAAGTGATASKQTYVTAVRVA